MAAINAFSGVQTKRFINAFEGRKEVSYAHQGYIYLIKFTV